MTPILEKIEKSKNENTFVEENNPTKTLINETINSSHSQGWTKFFKNEKQYKIFVDCLANYFEGNSYTIPKNPIEMHKKSKTTICITLNQIHKELTDSNQPLSKDFEFHNIVRSLSPLQNDKNIIRSLQRNTK